MRFFAGNEDYRAAMQEKIRAERLSITNPITYRILHEHAAGMGLGGQFFAVSGIDPDAPVTCNCHFDEGHEPHCDLVYANQIRQELRK